MELNDQLIDALADLLLSIPGDSQSATAMPTADGDTNTGNQTE